MNDEQTLCRDFMLKYPRPALIMRRKCPRTWRAMILDGYFTNGDGHAADGEARLAVARAARTYDLARGTTFATWACGGVFLGVRSLYAKAARSPEAGKFLLGLGVMSLGVRKGEPDFDVEVRADPGGQLDAEEAVRRLLTCLTPAQREDVVAYYGLLGRDPEGKESIGARRGVLAAAISVTLSKARRRLRSSPASWASAGLDFEGKGARRGK